MRRKTTSASVLVHRPGVLGRSGSVRSRMFSSFAVPEARVPTLLQVTVMPSWEIVVLIRTTCSPRFPAAKTAVRVPCG